MARLGGLSDAIVELIKISTIEIGREGNVLYQVSNWQAPGQAQNGVIPTFGCVVS